MLRKVTSAAIVFALIPLLSKVLAAADAPPPPSPTLASSTGSKASPVPTYVLEVKAVEAKLSDLEIPVSDGMVGTLAPSKDFLWNLGDQKVNRLADKFRPVGHARMTLSPSGETSSIALENKTPLTYFERVDEETFKLRTMSGADVGVTVSAQIKESDGSTIELSPLKISFRWIGGREAVSGVDLPIGKPITETYSKETALTMRLGELKRAEWSSRGEDKMIWVLLRVSGSTAQEGQVDASTSPSAAGVPVKWIRRSTNLK